MTWRRIVLNFKRRFICRYFWHKWVRVKGGEEYECVRCHTWNRGW